MSYVLRRIGYSTLLLLAVSVFSFAFLELAPGEFFDEMKMNPQISPETIGALRERYGLTASPVVRYLHWLQSAAQGDFGYSFAYNMPASSLLWARAGNTLLLTVPAMLMAWLVALPLGVWSALRQGGWVDRLCGAGSSALLTLPDLLVAMLFLLLALRTGWFPTGGMLSPAASDLTITGRLGDLAFHALLPICALVAGLLPLVLRVCCPRGTAAAHQSARHIPPPRHRHWRDRVGSSCASRPRHRAERARTEVRTGRARLRSLKRVLTAAARAAASVRRAAGAGRDPDSSVHPGRGDAVVPRAGRRGTGAELGNMLANLQRYHVLTSYWWMFAPTLALIPATLAYYSLTSLVHERVRSVVM